jgi:hypothetical protein
MDKVFDYFLSAPRTRVELEWTAPQCGCVQVIDNEATSMSRDQEVFLIAKVSLNRLGQF